MKTRFYAKDSLTHICNMCKHIGCNNGSPEYGDSLDCENVIACNSFQDVGYGVYPDEYDGIDGIIYANDTREKIYFTPRDYESIAMELIRISNCGIKRFSVICPDAGLWNFIIPNTGNWKNCFPILQYGQKKDNDFLQSELNKEINRQLGV